ncbi:ABC transporter substrate-binding protein [Rhodococcus opacus]|uniref:ABC transporter substrate-binding protein n=1 Tax=Rhodococcus opacus TaxID=37919 RepID=UPI0007CD401D|nr:ABC transporter substrate-binding protein [Rhodococcus opacus]MDX5964367.1 ABC transporter substrate-binding protein [Rhodococcus opacus]NKY76582.1 peptide-binding protein [Rhodococcus opacus]UNN02136.1 ABC transporter substrate-binding protein [Rhodococcus opacus]CAG7628686.1 putative lipoprotein [Rhodococcus opacus]
MPASHSTRRGAHTRRGRITAVSGAGLLATVVLGGSLVGCSEEGEQIPSIGYAIDNTVTTYNANSVAGAVSGARQAFARVLPGFNYTGPEGGPVADTDIGTANAMPGDALTIQYKLNPNSVYSDGVPMSCDDLVLTWAANSGRFPMFDAASTAGYSDIDRVDCQTGAKDAVVTFKAGRTVTDWKSLFDATSMMPAHVVASAAGVPDIVAAVQNSDADALTRVADFWNDGWTMAPGDLDLAKFPASGPYKVESFSEDEGLVLVANDRWWGNRPATSRIVVWPKSSDVSARIGDGSVEVVDVAAGSAPDLDLGGFDVTEVPSRSVEQFVLSTSGLFENAAGRRAFAACLPREELASKFGIATEPDEAGAASGGPVDTRVTAPDSLVHESVAGAVGGRYETADTAAAADALADTGNTSATVRVGYLGPNPRRAEIVAAVAAACAPAGITVQDVASPEFTPSMLREGQVDVVLAGTAAAPGAAGTAAATTAMYALRSGIRSNFGDYSNGRVDQIVDQLAVDSSTATQLSLSTEAENILWSDVPTVPLFDQPRTVAFATGLQAGAINPTRSGAGWNMDRWVLRR